MTHHFAICLNNEGFKGSLELRKLYEIVADSKADLLEQIRIIDESGDDYFYPARMFIPIALPEATERLVSHVT